MCVSIVMVFVFVFLLLCPFIYLAGPVEGVDHTKTLSRTLAGFRLTWHQKVHFSTFDGKLEGSFMTKYLQIGFWISLKARGFWLNGLRRKSILKNDPQNEIVFGKLGNLQISLK